MSALGFTLRADEELLAEDHFCGAGGTTTGVRSVAGWRVVHAANHDKIAIATHSHNYSDVEHSLADIPSMDPYKGPKAHVLFTSPECKARSYARGRPKDDPSLFDPKGDKTAERSRATMDEVTRFAEARRYVMVVVENVPQVVDWCERSETHHHKDCNCGATYRRWLRDMENVGYRRHRALFLNSMLFPPTPQSRDRYYGVFVLDGVPFPDLDHTCAALCPEHGLVMAEQRAKAHLRAPAPVRKAWGPLDTVWGRYGQQYIYACPDCGGRCEPAITPAATAIEWWRDPGARIGERVELGLKALELGTIARVGRGIQRLPERPMVVPLHHLTNPDSRRARDVMEALGTLTAQLRDALVVAVGGNLSERPGQTRAWPLNEPLRTLTATADRGLVVAGRENAVPKGIDSEVLGTQTGGGQHAVVTLRGEGQLRRVDEPLLTCATVEQHALVRSPFTEAELAELVAGSTFRMLEPTEIGRGMVMHLTAEGAEYVIHGSRRQQVRQLGNAVTPPVAAWIAGRIRDCLQGS